MSIDNLFNEMDKKNVRVTFGLQPEHIKVIEEMLSVFEGAKYSEYIWNDIGKKIGWHPFTAALYYFRHLEEKERL